MKMLNIYKIVVNGRPFDLLLNGESVKDTMQKAKAKHAGKDVYFLQMDEYGDFHKVSEK